MIVPDFQSPIERTTVSGFPVRFRKDRLSEDLTLWVPQRITRNRQSAGWRIIINHATGQLRLWEGDLGRSPVESLEAAWETLVGHLKILKTPVTMKRRKTLPGRKRDPRIDTGIDGVLIARKKARNGRYKAVSVRTIQRIADSESVSRPVSVDTFHVSESTYLESPGATQKRFEKGLCMCAAIRARYVEEYAQAGPVSSPVMADDIETGRVPAKPIAALNLGDIFDSF